MLDDESNSMEHGMEAQLTESTGEHRRHRWRTRLRSRLSDTRSAKLTR
jgi:hypothetical protein